MHKWRLLLLLVLSLLQPILSEHILIDGRQCSSISSSQGERSNGKYPFDKPISDTLRLNALRENRRDGQRYGERHGTLDSRFSDGSHLERRILTTYDRGHNIYEQRLYRTERDGRRTFDRDSVRKQHRQIIQNNAAKRDTSPFARTSQRNREHEIRMHFAPIQTPLQARRTFNENLKIRDSSGERLRNENWTSNLNNVDKTLERTSRNFRIRQNVEKTKINENNGDMFRQNVRKRDLTTYSQRDEATNGNGFMTERWERNISKKQNRKISKSFDSNRYSRYIVRDTSSVSPESKTHQRDVKQIKNEHIISSLDVALKSFERNYQTTARSTPIRRTNVRNKPLDTRNTEKVWYGERHLDGEQVINRVIEQYDDVRRSLYEYARNNLERRLTVERQLQQQGSLNNAQKYANDRTNTRIEKTYLRNLKREIPYQRNLRLREVTRRIVDEDVSRNQKTRNMYTYDRLDTRKQERSASDNFDRSEFGERDLRQQRKRTSTSEFAARRTISIQKDERQQNAEKLMNRRTTSRREERNTNVRDGRTDRIQWRYERAILDSVDPRVLDAQRNGFRNYEQHRKDNRHNRIKFSQRAAFPHSRQISDAYNTRKGNEIKQNINKRSTDVRERSVSADRALRRSDVTRITDRQIIRSREELNALLERDSGYMTERTVSERGVRESDIRRITSSAERIIRAKDEREAIQYNTRAFKTNNKDVVAFAEHGNRLRNAGIKNKPVALVREERAKVSSERMDITNNKRDLREPINKRNVLSRQELQRNARVATNEKLAQSRDVRNEREREQTHLRYNDRGSRYNTRDRAMFAEREAANVHSRNTADDNFKYEQELQRADVTKERLRMVNNIRYSKLAIRERTASIEQNSYLRNERKYIMGTDRNIDSNTERFVRDNARERAKETREQNAIRLTDKQLTRRNKESGSLRDRTRILDTTQPRQSNLYFSRSRTESSLATLRRTDERNYRAEGNLLNRNYERALDLYREARSKIRINVERDHSRRQSESAYKRNIFGNSKAFITATTPENQLPTVFFWQYLFYAIQGIYIFGVFMQIFRQKDAKTSSMAWIAVTPHIKVD